MSKIDISTMALEELLKWFVEFSIRQGRALYLLQSSRRVNQSGDQICKIAEVLKQRPGDQRNALLNLFAHSNPWVRFNAAQAAIDVAPVNARLQIQAIADSGEMPIAAHAGMFLSFHDGELSDLIKH